MNPFTYYAFISYKRADGEWAQWLRRSLQAYRLPLPTRRRHRGLPARCSPVFLDKTNLTPGYLDQGLREEVQSSRYLLVICSRAAHAGSKYLDDEIQFFLDGGGEPSRIIPFAVDGAPEEECYPLRLLAIPAEERPPCIRAEKASRRKALLRLLARMHGIEPEEIERDDLRRRRRGGALLAAAAALCLFALWRGWDYYTPKTAFYLDYVERYGVPEGVIPLSREETASMPQHYVLLSSRGLVRELRCENSAGKLAAPNNTEWKNRPVRAVYDYGQDRALSDVTYYDTRNRPKLVLHYTNQGKTVDLTSYAEQDSYRSAAVLSLSTVSAGADWLGEAAPDAGGITRYRIVYDKNGFVLRTYYIRGVSPDPVSGAERELVGYDANGVSGVEYKRDGLGRATALRNLVYTGSSGVLGDPDDPIMEYLDSEDASGVSEKTYRYDDAGNMTSVDWLGRDGQPVLNADGYAGERDEYDESHRAVRAVFLGTDGEPALCADGYAVLLAEYDEHGFRIRYRTGGTDGEPVLNSYGYAMAESDYDSLGRLIRERYFGLADEPAPCSGGYAAAEWAYDERDNIIRWQWFGTDGEPAAGEFGFAAVECAYDERDNLIRQQWFGTDGQPAAGEFGFAAAEQRHDEDGRVVYEAYYGTDGQPFSAFDGYASFSQTFDQRGNVTSQRYFGTDGRPVLTNGGYASWTGDYDERDNLIRESWYGTDAQPAALADGGFASCMTEYDERGNVVRTSYFGPDGAPTACANGYASITQSYDHADRLTGGRYYDRLGALTPDLESGAAIWTREYDEQGNLQWIQYFNADGTPAITPLGCSRVRYDMLDERGFSYPCYCDAEGTPLRFEGAASYEVSVNARGDILRFRCLDENGESAAVNGAAGIVTSLSGNGWLLSRRSFGREELPEVPAVIVRRYDMSGRLLGERYLNPDGTPAPHQDSFGTYSAFVCAYDDEARESRMRFLGAEGEPVLCVYGYAERTSRRSQRGQITEYAWYGTDGKPAMAVISDNYIAAREEADYDEWDAVTAARYYNAEGAPTLVGGGFAAIAFEYRRDAQGNLLAEKRRYFGTDGKPALIDEGYAEVRYEYNEWGKTARESYFGVEGEPVLCSLGYASAATEFDERGNEAVVRYYGTDGQPCETKSGVAWCEIEYTNRGEMTAIRRYDLDGNLIG